MTSSASSAVQSAVPSPEPAAESQGVQPRTRAESVPTALPLTPVTVAAEDPADRLRAALAWLGREFVIPKGTNLLRVDHGSLHSAHVRHQESVGQCRSPAARACRRAWGWVHLVIKACLDVLEWLAESPVRTAAAVIVYMLCSHWL